MIKRVEDAILTYNPKELSACYQEIFKESLDTGCSSCWRDAIVALTGWIRQQEEPKADINLFVMVYDHADKVRDDELKLCLKKNTELREKGIFKRVVKVKVLATFEELFSLTKNYPDDINIIANSDIFFNKTIEKVHGIKRLQVYCLSRYDLVSKTKKAHLLNRVDSQDVWIVRGHIRKVKAGFSQGRHGCDNRVAFEFKKAGYEVMNPSKDIQAIHVHESNKRPYFNTGSYKIDPPYLLLTPHRLGEKPGQFIRHG